MKNGGLLEKLIKIGMLKSPWTDGEWGFAPQDPELLKRSIRVIDNNTIELRRFDNGARWLWWFAFFLGVYNFFIKYYLDFGYFNLEVWSVFDVDGAAHFYTQMIFDRTPELTSVTTYESKFSSYKGAFEAKKSAGLFILTATIAPLVFALFFPYFRGVRIDRKRRVAYTWRYFRLHAQYINSDGSNLEIYTGRAGLMGMLGHGHGPFIIALPEVNNPKQKNFFRLGRLPIVAVGQSYALRSAVAEFVERLENPSWFEALQRNPRFKYTPQDIKALLANWASHQAHWPKSTERRLDEYLARYRQINGRLD